MKRYELHVTRGHVYNGDAILVATLKESDSGTFVRVNDCQYLLNALQDLLHLLRSASDQNPSVVRARAAIARATGGAT